MLYLSDKPADERQLIISESLKLNEPNLNDKRLLEIDE